jgi:EAL domain-containing protein (putative c-di-GMP-specific phosphodiesterase class I)
MPERPRTQRPPIDLAVELERAVERNEFGLEYQPIIDLVTGSIAAVEALLRWRHPLMGTIAPAEYLPLAEETGHIVPIGERVLDAATRQLRTWHLGFAR